YLYLPSVFFCLWLLYTLHKIINQQLHLAFVAVMVAASSWFLFQSRSYYSKAGIIAKTTIDEIGKLENKQTIFIQHLPQYHNGAVIFRLGLEEASNWLQPSFTGKIVMQSIDSSDVQRSMFYSNDFTVNYDNKTIKDTINSIMVKDASFKKNYSQKTVALIKFNKETDALFIFSNNALTIVK
ncbi:MAG: hypothetical protein H7178_12655, partial [Chitinophagaceae bacterium]|nr:hypothetical protein [Chitinophagaceae bacterium]